MLTRNHQLGVPPAKRRSVQPKRKGVDSGCVFPPTPSSFQEVQKKFEPTSLVWPPTELRDLHSSSIRH